MPWTQPHYQALVQEEKPAMGTKDWSLVNSLNLWFWVTKIVRDPSEWESFLLPQLFQVRQGVATPFPNRFRMILPHVPASSARSFIFFLKSTNRRYIPKPQRKYAKALKHSQVCRDVRQQYRSFTDTETAAVILKKTPKVALVRQDLWCFGTNLSRCRFKRSNV